MTTHPDHLRKTGILIEADPATEVVIVNGLKEKVASSTGKLETQLLPGIYKVLYKAGGDYHSELFEISDAPVSMHAPPLKITTPIPLSGTTKTHEYQQEAARHIQKHQLIRAGQDSEFVLFARNSDKAFGDVTGINPANGLTLQDLSGRTVLNTKNPAYFDKERNVTCLRAQVNPATYLLTLETASQDKIQIPVTTCPGWRTLVFIDTCLNKQKERLPDLYGCALIMNRLREAFSPEDHTNRYTELARYSLESGHERINVSALAQELLQEEQISRPILGIILGHLMLHSHKHLPSLIIKLVCKLEDVIPGHPDVIAIRTELAVRGHVPFPSALYPLSTPPMLRSSWDIFVQASTDHPEIFSDAGWLQYTAHLSGNQGWLGWQCPAEEQEPLPNTGINTNGMLEMFSVGLPSGLFRGDAAKKSMGMILRLSKSALTTAGELADQNQLKIIWGSVRTALSDPRIAKSPLQNALRRKILILLDEINVERGTERLDLGKIAQDLRVPAIVLSQAANLLLSAAQAYHSAPTHDPEPPPGNSMNM